MKILYRIYWGVVNRINKRMPHPNERIKNTNWYYNRFPHLKEYERLERNADVLCFGSTPGKNAIDFISTENLKGYNLAVCPETIFYDFQVLKNYHSYLKPGGMVVLFLTPFSFLKEKFNEGIDGKVPMNERYYPILHRAMIDNFDIKFFHKWVEYPATNNITNLRYCIKDEQPLRQMLIDTNNETPEISSRHCWERIEKWKKEFGMPDLDPNHIPDSTEKVIEWNLSIYADMKTFIEERGYKAIIVVPPYPEEMTSLLPNELVEHMLFEPIRRTGMPYLSYYGKQEWLSRDLYYHGFLLNAKGRKLFTKEILSRIQAVK